MSEPAPRPAATRYVTVTPAYQSPNMSAKAPRVGISGMITHFPPGVLTSFGHALRSAAGRIHWAGTETAINFIGTFDGAIESGQRAAQEVLAAE